MNTSIFPFVVRVISTFDSPDYIDTDYMYMLDADADADVGIAADIAGRTADCTCLDRSLDIACEIHVEHVEYAAFAVSVERQNALASFEDV